MPHPDVLVIGAGPAGLSAAAELAQLGLSVLLVEQRDQLGGAIYRRFAGAGERAIVLPTHHRQSRDRLFQDVTQAGARLTLMMESVFIGVDRDGHFLIDRRQDGRVIAVRPKAVILAVGTVERVPLIEGWELPGVVTAGGMQVQLKETGEAPKGSILLAGNGPLLIALAAQLAASGNPPLAVLERARPLTAALRHGGALVDALRSATYMREALLYGSLMVRCGVPYRTGWAVASIRADSEELVVDCRHISGAHRMYRVRHVALHDGLVENATGLPDFKLDPIAGSVVQAGDCREVLGAQAAILDGLRAARMVAGQMGRASADRRQLDQAIERARRSQGALARLFAAPAVEPSAETVICRCEGLRRSDLEQLQVARSAREFRLIGRVGMGACQGRFCAHAMSDLARCSGIEFSAKELNGDILRWPMRPVSVTALANYAEEANIGLLRQGSQTGNELHCVLSTSGN